MALGPVSYRFMPHQYVDEFFESGRLRLSTFHACRDLENPLTRDEREGQSNIKFASTHLASEAVLDVGKDCYLLCATLAPPLPNETRFGSTGCFRIDDPQGFSYAIAQRIEGVTKCVHRACEYHEARVVDRGRQLAEETDGAFQRLMNSLTPQATPDEAEAAFLQMRKELNAVQHAVVGDDPYFIKDKRFSEDREFRFVWKVSAVDGSSLLLAVPEAVQFCARIC